MTIRRLLRRVRDERGFTLIELSATMAVLGIFFAAASLVLSGAIRNSSTVEDQSVSQAESRAAVDGLADELRYAYTDSTLPGYPYSVQTWTASTLTFYTPDRQSPMHMRLVSYRISGGELQRASATSSNTGYKGPWTGIAAGNLGAYQTLVSNVSSTTAFTYWAKCTAVSLPTCPDTTTLKTVSSPNLNQVEVIRIAVQVSPRGSGGRKYTYAVNVSPRTT